MCICHISEHVNVDVDWRESSNSKLQRWKQVKGDKKVKPCLWQSAASTWKVYIPGLVIRTYPSRGIGEYRKTLWKSPNLCCTCSTLLDPLWDVNGTSWHDFRHFKYGKKRSISHQRHPSSELRNLRSIVDTAFVRFCSAVVHSAFWTCDFWAWEFRSKCSVVAICKYQSFPCLCMSIIAQYILYLKPSQQCSNFWRHRIWSKGGFIAVVCYAYKSSKDLNQFSKTTWNSWDISKLWL